MELLNQIEIDSKWGTKTFELYEGDITTTSADILVFSILEGFYLPASQSIVNTLHQKFKINLQTELDRCQYDFRSHFGCWVSQPFLENPFKKLLCVELIGSFKLEQTLQNIFVMLSILEMKGEEIKEIAIPLIGTGALRMNFNEIVSPLLEHSLNYLRRSPTLKKVKFIEINKVKAEQLNDSMNQILGRAKIILPKEKDIKPLREKIHQQIENIRPFYHNINQQIIDDLDRIITNDNSQPFEILTISRKFVEHLTHATLDKYGPTESLASKIRSLTPSKPNMKNYHIAEWIPYYLHSIRVFGNYFVHEKTGEDTTTPDIPSLSSEDVEIGLMCLNRILGFWLEYLQNNPDIQQKLKTINFSIE